MIKVTGIEWVGNKNLPTEINVDDYNVCEFEFYGILTKKYHCDISCYCIDNGKSLQVIIPTEI